VELDNIKSNLKDKDNNKHIDTLNIVWSSSIHKGTGKKALKFEISNSTLKYILDVSIVDKLNTIIQTFNDKIYDSKLFQIKNCRVPDERIHMSPDEILESIKTILDEEICDESFIETNIIFNAPYKYPAKILYGLYLVNSVVEMLN
jgi:hypothetical protein